MSPPVCISQDAVTCQIELAEGDRHHIYDDATGQPIVPGYKVIGKPTIGYGCLLCAPGGITEDEAIALLGNRVTAARQQAATLPVFAKLDKVRQNVVTEMVYQLGLGGAKTFTATLAALARGDYAAAAADIRHSHLAQETPARAERYARTIETGIAP